MVNDIIDTGSSKLYAMWCTTLVMVHVPPYYSKHLVSKLVHVSEVYFSCVQVLTWSWCLSGHVNSRITVSKRLYLSLRVWGGSSFSLYLKLDNLFFPFLLYKKISIRELMGLLMNHPVYHLLRDSSILDKCISSFF